MAIIELALPPKSKERTHKVSHANTTLAGLDAFVSFGLTQVDYEGQCWSQFRSRHSGELVVYASGLGRVKDLPGPVRAAMDEAAALGSQA